MNSEQAKKIVEDEHLSGAVWPDDPLRANSIAIRKAGSAWELFYTDERAVPWPKSVRKYHSEPEALADFVERLRQKKSGEEVDRKILGM